MHDLLLPKGRSSLVAIRFSFLTCSQLTRWSWHVFHLNLVFETGIFHGHSSEGICIFGSFKALKLRYLSPDHGKACAIAGEGVTAPMYL